MPPTLLLSMPPIEIRMAQFQGQVTHSQCKWPESLVFKGAEWKHQLKWNHGKNCQVHYISWKHICLLPSAEQGLCGRVPGGLGAASSCPWHPNFSESARWWMCGDCSGLNVSEWSVHHQLPTSRLASVATQVLNPITFRKGAWLANRLNAENTANLPLALHPFKFTLSESLAGLN